MTTTTYPLAHEVILDAGKKTERVITELTLREPTARDLRSIPVDSGQQTWAHQIEVIASLSGEPVRVINEIHGEDFLMLVGEIQKKLGAGQ